MEPAPEPELEQEAATEPEPEQAKTPAGNFVSVGSNATQSSSDKKKMVSEAEEHPTFVFVGQDSLNEIGAKAGQVNMTGVVDLFVAERQHDLVEYFRSVTFPKCQDLALLAERMTHARSPDVT